LGLSAQEIEQRLVARGVAAADAAAAVASALAERARGPLEIPEESDPGQWAHRLLSALAVAVCVALAYWYGGQFSAGKTLIWTAGPLGCIWFSDALSGSAGPGRSALLRWCGWFLLLLIGGYRIVLLTAASQ
jgi:hypothetical protein